MTLHSLAHVEFALGRPAEAAELLDRARRGVRRHAARVLPSLSAAEQTSFLGEQDEAAFHRAITRGLVERASPTLAAIQAIRGEAARVSQQIPASDKAAAWRAAIDGLQAEEHRLIHDIGGQLAALDRDEPWVEIDEIRRTIPGGSVLVDIARFGIFDFKANGKNDKWQPARYAAWITPPAGNGDVTIVDLGDAAEIDGLVADYRRAIEGRLVDLDAAEPLSAKVLWPILAALPSGGATVEELVLSPDGALWLVPWQALPLKDGSFAIERYAIRTVTSGRDLVPPPMDAAPREGALPPLVVADPAFDEAPRESEPSAVAVASTPALPGSAGRVLPKVQGLAATRREAEAARGSLAKVAGLTPAVRVGREATAAGVQREAVRPKVLVLATHGFFLADQQVKHDERLMLAHTRGIAGTRPLDTATGKPAEDPLLRCGLLFTGANLPAERLQPGGDDGVLTGAEIVGLDLLGTDLVVLSACETGVGRVDVGEGVAGLRQAFQIAGAKTVIATLWHVPDKESAEIMSAFYENLADGQPPSRALRTAQISFIRAHREKNDAATDHPYYWAAYGTTGR